MVTTWSSSMAIWWLVWPPCARFQPLTCLCVPATLGCIWQNPRSPITLLLVTALQVKLDSVMSVHWLPDPISISACSCLYFPHYPQRTDYFSVVYRSHFFSWWDRVYHRLNKWKGTLIISVQMLGINTKRDFYYPISNKMYLIHKENPQKLYINYICIYIKLVRDLKHPILETTSICCVFQGSI